MVLLDSNIIIYLKNDAYASLIAKKLAGQRLATCNIVITEVLGYNRLEPDDERYFYDLFVSMNNLVFDEKVTKKAIDIRKHTALQLPDAIIAATACVNNAVLWTHNTDDFKKVDGLMLFDPIV